MSATPSSHAHKPPIWHDESNAALCALCSPPVPAAGNSTHNPYDFDCRKRVHGEPWSSGVRCPVCSVPAAGNTPADLEPAFCWQRIGNDRVCIQPKGSCTVHDAPPVLLADLLAASDAVKEAAAYDTLYAGRTARWVPVGANELRDGDVVRRVEEGFWHRKHGVVYRPGGAAGAAFTHERLESGGADGVKAAPAAPVLPADLLAAVERLLEAASEAGLRLTYGYYRADREQAVLLADAAIYLRRLLAEGTKP